MLRSKLSASVGAALLMGMVSLTGCGTNNSASGTDVHTNSVRGVNDGRIGVKSVQNANSYDKMEMSQKLADRVSAMPEVSSANVMLVGKSAYVAVKLDEANGKPATNSTHNTTHNTIHNYRSYSYGNGNSGNAADMLSGSGGPLGTGIDTGMTGRGTVNGTPGMTGVGGSNTGTARDITGTGNVGGIGTVNPQAYTGRGTDTTYGSNYTDGSRLKRDIDNTLGTGMGVRSVAPNNNYKMTATEDVTKETKDRIAAEVKKHDARIKNVYVSANPDFVERADYYAQEVRAGHPLKGFAKEFGTMVERIFPTRSGY